MGKKNFHCCLLLYSKLKQRQKDIIHCCTLLKSSLYSLKSNFIDQIYEKIQFLHAINTTTTSEVQKDIITLIHPNSWNLWNIMVAPVQIW